MDEVDLRKVFKRRSVVMKSGPHSRAFLQRGQEVGMQDHSARLSAREC